MKTLLILLLSSFVLFGNHAPKSNLTKPPVSTCYGKTPCSACSNCSGCKYCNNGGTCGVCSSKTSTIQQIFGSSKSPNIKAEVYVGQCKALTKKGARCKRSANGNGYCWQHGK